METVTIHIDDTGLRIWDLKTDFLDWKFDVAETNWHFQNVLKILLTDGQFNLFVSDDSRRCFSVNESRIKRAFDFIIENDVEI